MTLKTQAPAPSAVLAQMKSDIEGRLSALRAEIADRQGELEAVESGAVTRLEYRQRLDQWVDQQAVDFARTVEFQTSALRLPRAEPRNVTFGRLPVHGAGAQSFEVVAEANAAPMLCWLLGDEIKGKRPANYIFRRPTPVGEDHPRFNSAGGETCQERGFGGGAREPSGRR